MNRGNGTLYARDGANMKFIEKLVESQYSMVFHVASAEAHENKESCWRAAQSMANLYEKPVVLINRLSESRTFYPESIQNKPAQ